jgi:hypothetical protein
LASTLRSTTGGIRIGLTEGSATGDVVRAGSSMRYDAAADGVSGPGGVSLTRLLFLCGVVPADEPASRSDEWAARSGEDDRHDLSGVPAGESPRGRFLDAPSTGGGEGRRRISSDEGGGPELLLGRKTSISSPATGSGGSDGGGVVARRGAVTWGET